MTSPTNPQPTPPAGYEILSPEAAKMKPEGMKYGDRNNEDEEYTWHDYPRSLVLKVECSSFFERGCPFSAPLGTTALLFTPGPEAGECNCGGSIPGDSLYCEGRHLDSCPAHPSNAYVKVLPGWLAGLKEKPDGLMNRWSENSTYANKKWVVDNNRWPFETLSCLDCQIAYAVPRHVFDAIEAQRRPWSSDPIHEVAKMDESKLQGEQGTECNCSFQETPVGEHGWCCPKHPRNKERTSDVHDHVDSNARPVNAAPADGPNPSPGAAERVSEFEGDIRKAISLLEQSAAPFDAACVLLREMMQWHKDHPVSRTPPPIAGSGPTAEEMLEWLEKEAQKSPSGISFDWCRYAEEGRVVEKGFRYMRHHHLGDRQPTLRAAIAQAMQSK